jgi:hypothetical protein
LRTLARGAREVGLYRLLVDLVALVCSSEKLDEPFRFKEAHVELAWWDAIEIGSKPIVESWIDFELAVDGSIVEYNDSVVGFFHVTRVDLDDTLASRFSWDEGIDCMQDGSSVARGFKVHERDSHVYSLLIALCGLLLIP